MEEKTKLLYEDILGLIDFRGIKHGKIAEVMKMSYNNWYKTRLDHLRNLSLSDIDELADFLNLPAEQVFSLCFVVYKRGQAIKTTEQAPETEPAAAR